MAQGQRLNPAARDAAVRRITLITTSVVGLGLAGTVGLGVAIAAGVPVKDTSDTAAYEEVVVEEAPVPTVAPTPKVPTGNGKATTPTQKTPTQQTPTQKAPTQAPKPRVTTKAPQTASGGS